MREPLPGVINCYGVQYFGGEKAVAVVTCGNCGHDRQLAGCRCIPSDFWQRADTIQALNSADVTRIVRLLRAHTDLNQEAIARLTGLSQGMVSQVESGRRSLRDPTKKRRALAGLGAPAHAEPPATTASLIEAGNLGPDERDRLRYSLQHPSRIDGPAVAAFAEILATQRTLDDTLGAAALTPVTTAIDLYETDPVGQRRIGELGHARLDLLTARLLNEEFDAVGEQADTVLGYMRQRRVESVMRRLNQFTVLLDRPVLRKQPHLSEVREAVETEIHYCPLTTLDSGVQSA